MLHDVFKAALAIACVYLAVRVFRGQLAVMTPTDAAIAKRKFVIGLLAAAFLTGALTLVLLRGSR